jgi:hypothetical protein
VVCRKEIAVAKRTVCDENYDSSVIAGSTGTVRWILTNSKDNQAAAFTRNKVFTVYMEHGAKKSVLLNPVEPVVWICTSVSLIC